MLGDAQFVGDGAIGKPAREQLQHFIFTRGQGSVGGGYSAGVDMSPASQPSADR